MENENETLNNTKNDGNSQNFKKRKNRNKENEESSNDEEKHSHKKTKKNAQQNSKRSINLKHGPLEGKKGILITCQTGKEKRAMAELFNLFEDYAEQLYPNEEDISRNEEKEVQERELSIEKELELEIQALKEKKKTPIFQTFDTGCRGTFFMEILSPKINPVSFVHYIFEDIRKTKLQKTRFTCKLIPILNTCVSHYDKISKYSKEIIDPVLNEDKSIKSVSNFIYVFFFEINFISIFQY